jgi:hypothetical protein
MKKPAIITISILGIILGIGAFFYLNQPAQMLIRKTFKTILKLELVKSTDMESMRQQIKVLAEANAQLEGKYQKASERVKHERQRRLRAEEKTKQIQALIDQSSKDLANAKAMIKYLPPGDQILMLDQITIGEFPSRPILIEGQERVLTEISRIEGALIIAQEHKELVKRESMFQDLVNSLREENSALKEELAAVSSQLNIRDEQLTNSDSALQKCQDANQSAINQGKKWAAGGVGALILSALIHIIL